MMRMRVAETGVLLIIEIKNRNIKEAKSMYEMDLCNTEMCKIKQYELAGGNYEIFFRK